VRTVKRLEELRKARRLSRRRLGELAGISARTIEYAEAGRDIKVSTAAALASALGVTLNELVDERGAS
jgi:transcriptional regulator with XRE-family HTH domain